jgi:MFS transporter, putative metabolite:H+ symporter
MSSIEAAGPATPATGRQQVGKVFESVPFTAEHWKAGFALFFAFVIEAWELLIIVYASGAISKEFKLGPVEVGALLSAVFLGMIPGSLIWGPISDRIGRQRTAIWSLVGYGVVSLASAFAPNYPLLYALRFGAGLLMAGIFVITFLYFEELLPVRSRGKATVYLASGWPVGTLISVGVSVALLPLGWRWVIALSSLAALWALVIWKWVPESPYWLAARGRSDDAGRVIERLSQGRLQVGGELAVEKHRMGSLRELFGPGFAVLTIVQLLLNFCFSWGYWGLQTWLPTLLQERGLGDMASLQFVAIAAVFQIPGYVSASFLTSRFGRKKVFIVYVILAAIGGFAFAFAGSLWQLYLGSFVLSFFSLGAWGVWDTWIGELYPSAIRGVGYSWGVMGQRVANTVAPTVIGFLVARAAGFAATVAMIDVFLVATALLAFYFRETEGEDLR